MNIVCYGDSNTFGWDPAYFSGNHYDHPWPERMGEMTGHEVVNLGEPGRMIPRRKEALDWFCRDVLEHASQSAAGRMAHSAAGSVSGMAPQTPDLLVIMLGTNDLLNAPIYLSDEDGSFHGTEEAVNSIAKHMEEMIGCALQNKLAARVMLLSCPRVTFQQELYMPLLEKLADAYREIAQRAQILFADAFRWEIPMAFDGVHFSEDGHRLFAKRIAARIDG